MKLAPGLEKLMQNLKHEESVLGTVLSGAGPSVLVISKKNNLEKVKNIIRDTWNDLNIRVQLYNMPIEQNGAIIVSE